MKYIQSVSRGLLGNGFLFYIACASITIVLLVISLRLWTYDLNVPFNYWGDTLWFLVPIKSFLLNGSMYTVPQLSAPFELSWIGFPALTHFDWLISGGLVWILESPGLALNLLWLLSIVLTSLATNFSLHLLGANRWLSLIGALIYAFLPFVFLRNTAHIILLYYMVPFLCILTVSVAEGLCENKKNSIYLYVGYSACFIQGLSYIYYSFFASLLLVFAALLGYVHTKKLFPIRQAIIAIAILSFSTLINLSPTFLNWGNEGVPPNMSYKSAIEAEIYGLKIRKLLVPHPENIIYPLGKWAKNDASTNFPNENENITARLGIYGSLGFLLLLSISLSILLTKQRKIKTLANLSLFTLLVTTVGGFGAIFNLWVVPDIRAYNRFSVFLAFFAVAGLTLFLSNKFKEMESLYKRLALYFSTLLIFSFSMYDQCLEANYLVSRYDMDSKAVLHEKEIVGKMERIFPINTKVYQLPLTPFPGDSARLRMTVYDHARPFFWSKQLKWSWPSFSHQHAIWEKKISTLSGVDLLEALICSGFGAIWLDRYGYEDNGEKIIKELISAGAKERLEINDSRIVILDLQPVEEHLKKQIGTNIFNSQRDELLFTNIYEDWGKGFYGQEKNPDGIEFRWSKQNSYLSVINPKSTPSIVDISFKIFSLSNRVVTISIDGKAYEINASQNPSPFTVKLDLKSKEKKRLAFSTNVDRVIVPDDPRELYFGVMDFKIKQQ